VPAATGKVTLRRAVAKNADGTSITGTVSRRADPRDTSQFAAVARRRLQRRDGALRAGEPRQHPARLQPDAAHQRRRSRASSFRRATGSSRSATRRRRFPGTPDGGEVCVKAASIAPTSTELIYVAKDPKVMAWASPRARQSRLLPQRAKDATGPNPSSARSRTRSRRASRSAATHEDLHPPRLQPGRSPAARRSTASIAQIAARQNNLNIAHSRSPGARRRAHRPHRARQGGTAGPGPGLRRHRFRTQRRRHPEALCRHQTLPKLFVGFSGTEFWTLQARRC
jgi:hypothetical protein